MNDVGKGGHGAADEADHAEDADEHVFAVGQFAASVVWSQGWSKWQFDRRREQRKQKKTKN